MLILVFRIISVIWTIHLYPDTSEQPPDQRGSDIQGCTILYISSVKLYSAWFWIGHTTCWHGFAVHMQQRSNDYDTSTVNRSSGLTVYHTQPFNCQFVVKRQQIINHSNLGILGGGGAMDHTLFIKCIQLATLGHIKSAGKGAYAHASLVPRPHPLRKLRERVWCHMSIFLGL